MITTPEELMRRFPVLTEVVGRSWLPAIAARFKAQRGPRPEWYEQTDRDLQLLRTKVSMHELLACYKTMLRNHDRFLDAVYEIHGAALLASVADHVELHVSPAANSRRDFDVRAEIAGVVINADCKTRLDSFPVRPDFKDPEGSYSGSRAALDPYDADAMGLSRDTGSSGGRHISIPESTVIRQLIEKALAQLPDDGINVVLFGQIRGDRQHLERALFRGAPIADFIVNNLTREVVGTENRGVGTTVFSDSRFVRLSAVVWMHIDTLPSPIGLHYKFYANPSAATPITPAAAQAIQQQCRGRESNNDSQLHY
jgi:hypothetical protein